MKKNTTKLEVIYNNSIYIVLAHEFIQNYNMNNIKWIDCTYVWHHSYFASVGSSS